MLHNLIVLLSHSESEMNSPALQLLMVEINSPRDSKDRNKTVMDGNS